jgi:hypothetical protein
VRIFAEQTLDELLAGLETRVHRDICGREEQYILNVNEAQYVQYLVSEYQVEPLRIDFDAVSVSESKRFVCAADHPPNFSFHFSNGAERLVLTFHIPLSGSLDLLRCQPSHHIVWSEEVVVRGNELQYEMICFRQDKEDVGREFDGFKGRVLKQLEYVNTEVGQYNANLQKLAENVLTQRREELLKKNDFVASLGVPLRSSKNVPTTFSVPVNTPKKILAAAPKVASIPFSPEPTMDTQAYADILKTIHDVGKQFERMPATYSGKDEESLRDHILLMLEPRFEGSATGETFNKTGKTDILLRHEGNNIFVGECKFWSGKKGFLATIDQILSYLTWRDSKTAVVMFVRNKEISPVLETVKAEIPQHPCCDSFIRRIDDSWSEYNFHLPGDSNRSVKLAVLVFHIPSGSKEAI